MKYGETNVKKIKWNSSQIELITFDSKDNLYFKINHKSTNTDEVYKLATNSDTPTKIASIRGRISEIKVDKNHNVYFGADSSTYVLKQGETIVKKINGLDIGFYSIFVDKLDNVYFSQATVYMF